MNVTHKSVHKIVGKLDPLHHKRIDTSARQKNKYTPRCLYLECITTKTTKLKQSAKSQVMNPDKSQAKAPEIPRSDPSII